MSKLIDRLYNWWGCVVLWNIGQFKRPFPDPRSWAFKLRCFWYDLIHGSESKTSTRVKLKGLSFPEDLNTVEFEDIMAIEDDVTVYATIIREFEEACINLREQLGIVVAELDLEIKEEYFDENRVPKAVFFSEFSSFGDSPNLDDDWYECCDEDDEPCDPIDLQRTGS